MMTASALLSTFIALPASAQTNIQDIKIVATDAAAGDLFGRAVAISGTTVIVGADGNDDGGSNAGSAYLFDTRDGYQFIKLTAPGGRSSDFFGFSVAISGTTAIVGAYNDDLTGTAYLFDTRDGHFIRRLVASDRQNGDRFGWSVAISGNRAIVGAYRDNGSIGAAYLFNTVTGQQIRKIIASDRAPGDQFGISVAISSTTAIVGANLEDARGTDSGSAYLFNAVTGIQIKKLIANDARDFDQFGISVAISETRALIGADRDNSSTGAAYLFETTSTARQLGKFTASDRRTGDYFGHSVGISGTTAIIGSWGDDDNGSSSGSAYLFDTISRQQISKLKSSDAVGNDRLGLSVGISGETAIAGAYLDDDRGSASGSAYLFDFVLKILQQPQGVIVADGNTALFSVQLASESGVSFQWRRNGSNLANVGNISGAQSSILQIVASEIDEGYYDCVLTDSYGPITTDSAVLNVLPDPNACDGDINGDGILNFFDVQQFIVDFSRGCP